MYLQLLYLALNLNVSSIITRALRRAAPAGAVLLLGPLAGCASMAPTQTGFLRSYNTLDTVEGNPNMKFFRDRAPVQFHAIYIEPVRWALVGKADTDFNEDERQALMGQLSAALEEGMKAYPVAAGPGPGVLRLRSAITDIRPSSPQANVLLSALLIGPIDNGGASVEIEATNGEGEGGVAAMSASETGKLFSTGGFSRLGHAKEALSHLGLRFTEKLK